MEYAHNGMFSNEKQTTHKSDISQNGIQLTLEQHGTELHAYLYLDCFQE